MSKAINIKWSVTLLVGVSIIVWVIVLIFKDIQVANSWLALKEIPTVAGWMLPVIGFFYKSAWKWQVFQGWLVHVPNLNGTWRGTLQTNWKNPETGVIPGPIDSYLVIRQTLSSISCVQLTKESKSWSSSSSITTNDRDQMKVLDFMYSNKPRISVHDRSLAHDGACSLDIINKGTRKLVGKYWTDRMTKGEMTFSFLKNEKIEEFE